MGDSEENRAVDFEFDGKTIHATPGQSVGGALHAAEVHILSRSFKYHRPRGLFCCSGRCPNCLCTVDGTPNVRICTTSARAGLVVKSQNAWPSIGFDLLSIFDKFNRFMPVGFYYKSMYKPRWMWPIWEKIIRRIAGLGSVDRKHGGDGIYDKLNLFTDVAVVGGGLAGLHAALEAADAGVSVTLIDEQPALGGHLRHDPDLADLELQDLIQRVSGHPQIRIVVSAVVFGCYEGNYLGIQQGTRLIRLRAKQIIIATGGWERPYIFANNDRPGVLLASAAQRLLHLDHCSLHGTAVVVTDNAQGYRVARQLLAAGTAVAAIVDLRDAPTDRAPEVVSRFSGQTVLSANGARHVAAAVIGDLGGTTRQTIACQWIIQAIGFTPANSLLYQNGCKLAYDKGLGHAVVKSYSLGTHSAGSVNGTHDPDRLRLEAQRAVIAACAAIRPDDTVLAGRLREADKAMGHPQASPAPTAGQYISPAVSKQKFVCLCEDVTEKDVCDAVREGYSNIETLKRYSTVSMGPCQGKMCQGAAIAICARENQQSIAATGVTTARPPEQPVPLGVLAGRTPHLQLIRRTPLHDWHVQRGATMMDAGAWKRPQQYSNVEDEYAAVRERAGLIDVSTLGKIELRGKDVVQFLEFIYPNRFANLAVGRVRYGVICDDAGILLDDGTIARLADNRYFLTTTTGNADAIDSWFRSWLIAKPQLDVQMTNVSGSYSAMNLAGPRAREILRRLTQVDLSTGSMPYLAARECTVAGVAAKVLRIGFVGEAGYEIHVPSQYGLAVWEAIIAAGEDFGIAPFGIETQRLLRLEKKHLLPGVDTDALSNPLEADLPWIVKLDKPDFIGKATLGRSQVRGPRQRLVGFRLSESIALEPAALVIHNGRLGGRVTSCSFSPATGDTIGLAWVPADQAKNGDRIEIRVGNRSVMAVVQDEPFYDPAGERLKN